jgi:hypothetical protein
MLFIVLSAWTLKRRQSIGLSILSCSARSLRRGLPRFFDAAVSRMSLRVDVEREVRSQHELFMDSFRSRDAEAEFLAFLQRALPFMSAVVMQELAAGARTPAAARQLQQ